MKIASLFTGLLCLLLVLGVGVGEAGVLDGAGPGMLRSGAAAGARSEAFFPSRIAVAAGLYYVSDARAKAIYIYDSALNRVGELTDVGDVLGIAVDARGRIYVGSARERCVNVFDRDGVRLRSLGQGILRMPSDLALDPRGNLYVADSRANRVTVFGVDGDWVRHIGAEGPDALQFPSAVAIARSAAGSGRTLELYVADQGHSEIKVYDLEGRLLRRYGEPTEAFSDQWEGRFVRLQSLAVDARGRVHALDSCMNLVQVLDAQTGEFLGSYGEFGTGPGQLKLPLDLLIAPDQRIIVTSAGNGRLETFAAPLGS
jgi:DNA-binding beta-propeller fold protein YncE